MRARVIAPVSLLLAALLGPVAPAARADLMIIGLDENP
jgi:hypothetical protein